MDEKKKLVRRYNSLGIKLKALYEVFGLTEHAYRKKLGSKRSRPGRPSSTATQRYGGNSKVQMIPDKELLDFMSRIQEDSDLRCGRDRMTDTLRLAHFTINPKKVGRLMKENGLSLKRIKAQNKEYVRYRVPKATEPLTFIQMDIKQVWIDGTGRAAYILTIIDVFTRQELVWAVGHTMKWHQVKQAVDQLITKWLQPKGCHGLSVEIRNDNGPQFSAKKLKKYLLDNSLHQVFTHPYTPQENAHIESFHAILSRALQGYGFATLKELENRLNYFYDKYNNARVHGSTAGLPPSLFEQVHRLGLIKVATKWGDKHRLAVPLSGLLGNPNLKVAFARVFEWLDAIQKQRVYGTDTAAGPLVQSSPSVAFAAPKLEINYLHNNTKPISP